MIKLSEKRLWWEQDKGHILGEENIDDSRAYRSAFHRDYDRIIFSNPFHRLSKKTQVHPLSKNDHVHNRLTHSLETASVGRSLGNMMEGLIDEPYSSYDAATIVQAACLAHDIGNPPFGHAGEDVIKSWFLDQENAVFLEGLTESQEIELQKFDGNAQSFRIISQIQNNRFKGGMQLTISTLASTVKYPWFATDDRAVRDKLNFFETEKEIANIIFEELNLKEGELFKRFPLSYLMEISDDICYGLLDLQDAVELNIIKPKDTFDIFEKLCTTKEFEKAAKSGHLFRFCAYAINNLAMHAGEVFRGNLNNISKHKDLLELFTDQRLKEGLEQAKKFAGEKIFTDKRKIELELGAYNVLGSLLDNLIPAAFNLSNEKETYKSKRIIHMMGEHAPENGKSLYENYRIVIDYIVGMTDTYATYLAHQLRGMAY